MAWARFLVAELRVYLQFKAGFNPDQPRDWHGRWTETGESAEESAHNPLLVLTGGSGDTSGRAPIDLLEEEALGGHTYQKHINKSYEYLKARLIESRASYFGIWTVGERRAGSFTSLPAASKLVNSTISQNLDKIDKFVGGSFGYLLPFLLVYGDFQSPTGYEAYAPSDKAQPRIRETYSVTVLLRRSRKASKGYYVEAAWPSNGD